MTEFNLNLTFLCSRHQSQPKKTFTPQEIYTIFQQEEKIVRGRIGKGGVGEENKIKLFSTNLNCIFFFFQIQFFILRKLEFLSLSFSHPSPPPPPSRLPLLANSNKI